MQVVKTAVEGGIKNAEWHKCGVIGAEIYSNFFKRMRMKRAIYVFLFSYLVV